MSNPSICIPKVDRNITKRFIRDVFDRHLLGKIKKIDMIPNKKNFSRAGFAGPIYLFILIIGIILRKA